MKKDLEEAVSIYKDQIGFLKLEIEVSREDKKALQIQVLKLEDALIAIRAPQAYADLTADRGVNESDWTDEDRETAKQVYAVEQAYLRNIEEPIFQNADEMTDMLKSTLIKDRTESTSLHDNDES